MKKTPSRIAWFLAALGGVAMIHPASAAETEPAEPVELLPGAEDRVFAQPLQAELRRMDPETDGWETEVFQERAGEQLARWVAWLAEDPLPEPVALTTLADEACLVGSLRPPAPPIYQLGGLTAWRAEISDNPDADSRRGREAMRAEMKRLMAPWEAPRHGWHAKTKIIGVELEENEATTEVLFQADGPRVSVWFQINARWRVGWKRSPEGPPLVSRLTVEAHDEVASDQGQWFRDVTAAVLGEDAAYETHLRHGVDHWRRQLEASVAPGITANLGVAVGDANGDGLDDVFLPQPLSLPDRLLIQQPDGTAVDVSAEAGLDDLDPHASALFLDLDNDGDQDLAVGGDGGVKLYENLGGLRFQQRAQLPFSSTVDSMAAADYDDDGRIDLYLCGHTAARPDQEESVLGVPVPVYDAENGQPNLLLHHEGDWRFSDATEASGMAENNTRFSFAAAWEDFDNDGDQDLYVANDFGRNNLYRNDGGRFRDVAAEAGVEDISSGMSVSWADYNRDGLMDVYVGNMFSSAGNRVTYQRQFRAGADPQALAHLQRMARGNALFENRGGGGFADVSVEMGVTMGRWAWASRFVDVNNDGWQDLAIANGFVTNTNPDDL